MLPQTSRSIVNGNLLRRFLNQRVNIMVNIDNVDSSGKTLSGKTTDNQPIQVCLADPLMSPINGWVDVIGVPTGSDRINCEEVMPLFFCLKKMLRLPECKHQFQVIQFELRDNDEPFDTDSYDMLVQFLNNCDDVYKSY